MGNRRVVGYEPDGSPIYGSKIKGSGRGRATVSKARERTKARAAKARSSIVSGLKKRVRKL